MDKKEKKMINLMSINLRSLREHLSSFNIDCEQYIEHNPSVRVYY